MGIKLNSKYLDNFISCEDYKSFESRLCDAHNYVVNENGKGSDFLGWKDLPLNYDKEEFERIKVTAEKIKKSCGIFIVIGIGGSYLGARAAIEFCKSPNYNAISKNTPDIYFAGNSISPSAMTELIDICKNSGKDICINVISKSGKTTEPAIAFRIFRQLLEEKYGEEGAKERIFVTTDKCRGTLKELSNEKGYETFVVPDNVGGRYSVLTAVGLLPIAVAGIDIDDMMHGAQLAKSDFTECDIEKNDCYKYAVIRNILYNGGKKIEVLAAYDSGIQLTAEWWKQLYGESEGKDGKGIFPASVIFSTDLHSLGQLVQQGERNLFETVIDLKKSKDDILIPYDEKNGDGLNFVAEKSLHEVNRTAFIATVLAHVDGNVPNIILELDERNAENFGYLVYFFELACAISGYILNVNPFDQPGVEDYKNNMYALLGKPGEEHDLKRKELSKKLN